MTLDQWLRSQPYGAHARLAREAGISWNSLNEIRFGRSVPRLPTAKRIIEATGGAVTIADLCEPQREERAS